MSRLGMILTLAMSSAAAVGGLAQEEDREKKTPAALNFTMTNIDGEEVDLSKYHGHVVLVVNVASKCGLTPQYEGLQELHEKYAEKGLKVLGFPCNQFGKQEPGSEADIKAFCSKKFDVSFDMFSKIDVNGETRAGLYEVLTSADTKPTGAGDIKWNFEKFVLNRQGEVIARFEPKTAPGDPELIKVIEKALAEK